MLQLSVVVLVTLTLSYVTAHGRHFSLDINKEPENALNDDDFVQDAR